MKQPKTTFPVKTDDRATLLKFLLEDVAELVKAGFNQIEIHTDGKGNITGVRETRFRR